MAIALHKEGICLTDLKPANRLFDKRSRTTKFVDLAGVVRHPNLAACEYKYITEKTLKYTAPELRDDINDIEEEDKFDLTKAISWTVGHMISEMIPMIQHEYTPEILKRVEELCKDLQKEVPAKRIYLEEGLKRLKAIPDRNKSNIFNFKLYTNILKRRLLTKDEKIISILNLKYDIHKLCACFNDKLKVTTKNPEKYPYTPSSDKFKDDLLPTVNILLKKNEGGTPQKQVLILLGAAGSGKSSVLQKMFIDAIVNWKEGDPFPIFINLAMENDLKNFWENLKENPGMEPIQDFLFEDLIKLPLILFLDSLDESRLDLRLVNKMFTSLASYSNKNPIKIVVTCRTGYLNEENEDVFSKNPLGVHNPIRHIEPKQLKKVLFKK